MFQKEFLYMFRGMKIFLVDDAKVRNFSKAFQEFTDWGTNSWLKDIPTSEVWIAKRLQGQERYFAIYAAYWFEHFSKMKSAGTSKTQKFKNSDPYEKMKQIIADLRSKAKFAKMVIKVPKNFAHIEAVKTKLHNQIGKFKIWLVDGEKVRSKYKLDFSLGSNHEVTSFVPDGEIWVEDNLTNGDINAIMYHELVEQWFMKNKNLPYHVAHKVAAKLEWKYRKTGHFDEKYFN